MVDVIEAQTPETSDSERSGTITPHVPLKRIIVLVNPLSGGVGPRAADEARAILDEYPLDAEIVTLDRSDFDQAIQDAIDARPDALLVLAGDGTAGTIAGRVGPDGPLVAPLPGGTMNMLPKALYGTGDWKMALRAALERGQAQDVAGGLLDGHAFDCAAIIGNVALWAPAREAIRTGRIGLAWGYARRALRRAFTGRMRYSLDAGGALRAGALVLISPLISKVMTANTGLEAAAMNSANASEVLRLATHALMDDWRKDPAVSAQLTRNVRLRSRSRIPAIIDGETIALGRQAAVRFVPRAFRALAPAPVPTPTTTDPA